VFLQWQISVFAVAMQWQCSGNSVFFQWQISVNGGPIMQINTALPLHLWHRNRYHALALCNI